jgi:hypothetical protein
MTAEASEWTKEKNLFGANLIDTKYSGKGQLDKRLISIQRKRNFFIAHERNLSAVAHAGNQLLS